MPTKTGAKLFVIFATHAPDGGQRTAPAPMNGWGP
jgi:hypothetical protein